MKKREYIRKNLVLLTLVGIFTIGLYLWAIIKNEFDSVGSLIVIFTIVMFFIFRGNYKKINREEKENVEETPPKN